MTIIHSIILGIVQGLTEFLPVSSSGHLNLFPWVFNWQTMPESFDVALHIGTLLAIVIYFFKDWIKLIVGGYNQVVKKKKTTESSTNSTEQVTVYIPEVPDINAAEITWDNTVARATPATPM